MIEFSTPTLETTATTLATVEAVAPAAEDQVGSILENRSQTAAAASAAPAEVNPMAASANSEAEITAPSQASELAEAPVASIEPQTVSGVSEVIAVMSEPVIVTPAAEYQAAPLMERAEAITDGIIAKPAESAKLKVETYMPPPERPEIAAAKQSDAVIDATDALQAVTQAEPVLIHENIVLDIRTPNAKLSTPAPPRQPVQAAAPAPNTLEAAQISTTWNADFGSKVAITRPETAIAESLSNSWTQPAGDNHTIYFGTATVSADDDAISISFDSDSGDTQIRRPQRRHATRTTAV
jgi:hypothetical protein